MSTDVLLHPEGLGDALTRIFQAAGGSEEEARIIAVNLVEANLAGHDSHGVVRTQRYCQWSADGKVRFGQHMTTVIDSDAFVLLDGNMGFGQSIGIQAVKLGIEKAGKAGVALVGLRNVGHLGRIGEWAETACAAGLVSIHFVNAYHSMLVAPFGGADRRMSTNPVCIGVPNEGGDFLLDFATATVAEGKVLVAKRGGKPVPMGALVDGDGQLTTDPDALYGPTPPGALPDARKGEGALTAMGLHKGSGLSLACEMLAGALTGSGTCGPGFDFHNGMLSIYIDPNRLDDGHDWASTVRDYIDYVHACKPADPDAPVLIPGDPERKRRADRRANGLPLPEAAWDSILTAGEKLGLNRADLAGMAVMPGKN
ncbi:MAG: malate/lactate/ureidoglycolate dehydrogenase [Pseudomonadota bacterium]